MGPLGGGEEIAAHNCLLRETKKHDLLCYFGGCKLEYIAGSTDVVCYMNRKKRIH